MGKFGLIKKKKMLRTSGVVLVSIQTKNRRRETITSESIKTKYERIRYNNYLGTTVRNNIAMFIGKDHTVRNSV